MSNQILFTIGHSSRELVEFVDVLRHHGVTAVADVRSHPFSRRLPYFNRERLKDTLRENDIEYVFLGEELGARRNESCCYVDGKARYDLIEQTPLFLSGLDRIRKGAAAHCIAMMCAEKDPVACHRSILVAKALRNEFDIRHILSADEVESHGDIEQRLLRKWGMEQRDLFLSITERIEQAYALQANEMAYVIK